MKTSRGTKHESFKFRTCSFESAGSPDITFFVHTSFILLEQPYSAVQSSDLDSVSSKSILSFGLTGLSWLTLNEQVQINFLIWCMG